jgi:NADH-quinone oxidoreductase subunit M
MGILTLITFLPAAGAALLLVLPRRSEGLDRAVALLTALVTFALSLPLWWRFDPSASGMQFVESAIWIPRWDIGYRLGIDGLSLALVLLTTFLTPLALLSTRHAITDRVREFLFAMLLLETGMLGVFVATDLFLFYIFWEVMLVPMLLIIGIWGGQRRVYAAVKFFLYTLAGSLLMLVAILALYALGPKTFDLVRLLAEGDFRPGQQYWMFLAFFLAFAIKVPMWPLHTWLPDAHVEAPTAGSVILAAVLLKMGGYGMLRFALPLFPDAAVHFAPWIVALSVVGIIYGAAVALVQEDIKKLVAYSSVSHLGFVTLGIFAFTHEGIQGATFTMVSHGVSTGLLFLLVGVIYERRHTRLIADFGGLARVMPRYAAVLVFVCLSSAGLPGLNGFVGEFLVLVGSFAVHPWATAFAATGVILAAAYLLWMVRRVLFGPLTRDENRGLADLTRTEWLYLTPLLVLVVVLGVYPRPLLDRTAGATRAVVERLAPRVAAARLAVPAADEREPEPADLDRTMPDHEGGE